MRKGQRTRQDILGQAVALASEYGLEGLTIGTLAGRLGMSKSGLFAHFGSREDLQLATLKNARERFERFVFSPALAAPRGLPRLRGFFQRWVAWADDPEIPGGCVILGATTEYDDRPGPVRDALVASQQDLRKALARAVELAVAEGHLGRDTVPEQFAFELFAIVFAAHHDRRLFKDPAAVNRATTAFEALIARNAPRGSEQSTAATGRSVPQFELFSSGDQA
ncbi:MAG: TetR/AcrR family transcriptional regulator [Betaproteobacteria bacterium]|jgi:AcrR family transcriptional regulator|nr:TetR/AcrR family transcriptional regulator [Betaproteobacteria bacterium]